MRKIVTMPILILLPMFLFALLFLAGEYRSPDDRTLSAFRVIDAEWEVFRYEKGYAARSLEELAELDMGNYILYDGYGEKITLEVAGNKVILESKSPKSRQRFYVFPYDRSVQCAPED